MERRFARVLLACMAAAVVCLLLTMPPLRQKEALPHSSAPYFFDTEDRIDINTAPAAELECLPGIGEVKAQAILAYRAQHGPFASVEELENVEGISARMVEAIADLVCCSESLFRE